VAILPSLITERLGPLKHDNSQCQKEARLSSQACWAAQSSLLLLDNLEVRHHSHVLMFQLVTVQQVLTPVSLKLNEHVQGLAVLQ
jgi:hypothetical protein